METLFNDLGDQIFIRFLLCANHSVAPGIERFHVTSQPPCWCTKTKEF